MGIKKYIVFSLIFLVAVGVYVYSFNGNVYTLSFFGANITLHIALWVVLPALLIVIASVLHMMFYSVKGYFVQRNLQKDYKTFLDFAKLRILGIDAESDFRTIWYKLPVKILKHFKFDDLKDPNDIEDEDIKNTILDLKKVEKGEIVDLKKYKLPKDNYFVQKNMLNKLAKDKKYAEEILSSCKDKEGKICKKAFDAYASYETFSNIKKQGYRIDRELFEKLLDRVENPEDSFNIEKNDIYDILKEFNCTKIEYIKFAKKMKKILNPETLISLYEKLSNENELATQAYLYILFEYQMIDKAREILENTAKNEYEKFKYFLFLRDNGKNFDIDLFFDI